MLPLLYPDAATREALLADPQSAPIPPAHRELFRFAEKFVRGSWESGPADLQRLRSVGLSERDIVLWATLRSTQSWFTMSADGGGVPLEGDALTGTAVGRTRDAYEANSEGLLAAPDDVDEPGVAPADQPVAWVEIDERRGASEAAEKIGQAAKRLSRPLPSTARPPLREENRVVGAYLGADVPNGTLEADEQHVAGDLLGGGSTRCAIGSL